MRYTQTTLPDYYYAIAEWVETIGQQSCGKWLRIDEPDSGLKSLKEQIKKLEDGEYKLQEFTAIRDSYGYVRYELENMTGFEVVGGVALGLPL